MRVRENLEVGRNFKRIVKGPGSLGLPSMTASIAPRGSGGGGAPYVISSGRSITCPL
jgi:hypothetical protein